MQWIMYKTELFRESIEQQAIDIHARFGVEKLYNYTRAIEDALGFINYYPHACKPYLEIRRTEKLSKMDYRYRNLNGFAFSVYFHTKDTDKIILDVMCPHDMDTATQSSGRIIY